VQLKSYASHQVHFLAAWPLQELRFTSRQAKVCNNDEIQQLTYIMTPDERAEFAAEIAEAIRIRSTDTGLSEEEQRWVRLAIQAEVQRIEFRKTVIEKTLLSLIWAGVVGLGYIVLGWATNHGYKP
jgi:hypothetical protein